MVTENKMETLHSRFSIRARIRSFNYAWEGIVHFFRTEHNAQLHLAFTVLTIVLSVYYKISARELIAVVFSIALVWLTEMINTAIEKTMDMITLERRPQIKIIKDISAGAVLVAAVAALVTGIIIFFPKIFIG